MDKKKLLLVAISVGAFLMIVIGAAVLAFPTKGEGRPVITESAENQPIPPGVGQAKVAAALPNPEIGSPEKPEITVILPEKLEYEPYEAEPSRKPETAPAAGTGRTIPDSDFLVSGSPRGEPAVRLTVPVPGAQSPKTGAPKTSVPAVPSSTVPAGGGENSGEKDTPRVITIPRPQAVAVPNSSPAGTRSAPAPAKGTGTGGPKAAAPVPVPAAPKQAPVVPSSGAAPRSGSGSASVRAGESAGEGAKRNSYWVQTGSFTAQSRAEGAQDTLKVKGFGAVIENRIVNGKTWFRVRVGPYLSKNEADYWLEEIKTIKGFENSQVWQTGL